MAYPERHRRNKHPDADSNSKRPLNELSTGELIKHAVKRTAALLKLELELRRATRMRGLRSSSLQPDIIEQNRVQINPEDTMFFTEYDGIAKLLFTLPQKAEQSPVPGEVALYGPNDNESRPPKQIGIIKRVPDQWEQDLVVLNNGVILLIGPNPERESEASEPYRERIKDYIVPEIKYTKDYKITDASVTAVKEMFDYTMQAQVLLTSEKSEDRDQLYPLIIQTFRPRDTFIKELDKAVHTQKAEETAARDASSVIHAAEIFVWDAELDAYNTKKESGKQKPPTQTWENGQAA